ncbi:hypothetical protein FPSE_02896 [Fusarium pseudograminearum CS3096]|uniref:Uncharacterized protein n=1 Tax=Fusarium pseudograminearum (strain CS3096) TaxID=1028729 RepID=K3VSB6_FUSPC|nr:hypothetical protein FPSE_02896 [Fusarium pseudograminearum CS3096]EKJ76898.1 hypothetical protein FPSE_02896 [Fusarium pseudograminearum CS3096]
MRLIDVTTLKMKEFFGKRIPPYAILSHRWGDNKDEVSFSDMKNGSTKKVGMAKVLGCCEQAKKDEIKYIWIDTCCIDKGSSTELEEAINSMFQWYRKASVCYTYMSDVPKGDNIWDPASKFCTSSWFQRGWTLQELLAPVESRFYDQEWNLIGTKADLSSEIGNITDIPRKFLLGWADFRRASVAQRMSWAAKRKTKRIEDMAYCLLGIFNISMPMIYGEGAKAFERLQSKILVQTTDDSILAWGTFDTDLSGQSTKISQAVSAGAFASSPKDFARCGRIVSNTQIFKPSSTITISGGYVNTSLTIHRNENQMHYGGLNCYFEGNDAQVIAIPLFTKSSATGHIRPQSYGPILVAKPPAGHPTSDIRIRVDRQLRPAQTTGKSVWLHVQGYRKLRLKLAETYPPLEWQKSRALLYRGDSKSGAKTHLLRFTSGDAKSQDLIVVIELNPSGGASTTHSFVIQAFKDLELKDIANSLKFIDPKSRKLSVADNGVMEVKVTITREPVPQGEVCLVSLGRTNKASIVGNKHSALLTAKLKYDFMDALKKEYLAGTAESSALQSITALKDRRESAKATLREIEEEEKRLAERKKSVQRDIDNLTDRIVTEESQIQGRLNSYEKFQTKRLKVQSILDGKTTYTHGQSKNQLLCLFSKGEVVHGPGNWFEHTLQRLLERVEQKSYSWPIEVGQHTQDLSPLLWSVTNSKPEFADLLLNKGSDTEAKYNCGTTALSAAACHGKTWIARILLNHGAQLEAVNERKLTPLIYASYSGHKETVALLLEKGANIKARSATGGTALSLAALKGHEHVVGLLLEKGANVESKDEDGDTPLAKAASEGHAKTTARLLKEGARIETQNVSQQTPLTIATLGGHEETMKLLLASGAYIEARDKRKCTPLMLAAAMGYASIVRLLLERGADVEARDWQMTTPMQHAASSGHKYIVKMISDAGARN